MKLLILHLSDIHFQKREDYSEDKVESIIKAIKTVKDCSTVVIIVSGDIAHAGKCNQYNVSYKFLSALRSRMKKAFSLNDIPILLVPGNHDIDYDRGSLSHKDLEMIYDEKKQDIELNNELNKMVAFYNHANGLNCFPNKKELVHIKEININGKVIQFNLINTAAYSSLEEDQGMHYLPENELDKLNKESTGDFVITVMHHPHHWFHSKMKKRLEEIIYEKSDLIFVGHEHYSSSLDIGMHNSQVKIYAGGELSNKGDWSQSEFNIGVLDLETREYRNTGYKLNERSNIYVSSDPEVHVLSKNRINTYGIEPRKEFMAEFLADRKYMICPNVLDYYCFPRLEESTVNEKRMTKEISDINDFIKEIDTIKRVTIMGRVDSGKSVLLRALFVEYSANKLPIYIHASDIKRDYEYTIRTAFQDIYSSDNAEFERFKQADKHDKILLLDDVDGMDTDELEKFLNNAEKEFDIVIYSMDKVVQLDVQERLKQNFINEKYTIYELQAFYKDKRRELVGKVVKILVQQDKQAQDNIVNLLCEALSMQKNIFRMAPDFIVQFTKYYCTNIGETIQNDGEVFSKVFEANIVSLLKPYAKNISVDKILIVLDKIAYGMHCSKKYPMDQSLICEIITQYNDEFDSEIDYVSFLEIIIKSNIFIKDQTKYYFSEKNYLAYFVAREIKRQCIENHDYDEFNKALEFSCYGINSDILLFVTYITDNINLIRMIMEKAEECTSVWEEFSVTPINISYLADTNQLKVASIDEKGKKQSLEEDIQKEKEAEKKRDRELFRNDVYDYDEQEELSQMKKMIRSVSLLVIISRTLPSFEHMMKKEDKEKCVKLLYTMPLKIFNVWAKLVEDNKLELIDEIKELGEWEYRKEKKTMESYEALNILRWESISLLLELMNMSIGNSTKKNTHKFLDAFDYQCSTLYEIEHLMGLDKRDAVKDFVKEAEMLYLAQKKQLPKLMIQRVTRHYMINSKKINMNQVRRLNDKLWEGKLDRSVLLLSKKRNEKKEQ